MALNITGYPVFFEPVDGFSGITGNLCFFTHFKTILKPPISKFFHFSEFDRLDLGIIIFFPEVPEHNGKSRTIDPAI